MTVINKHLTKTPLKSCLCYHGTEGRGSVCVCVCVCVHVSVCVVKIIIDIHYHMQGQVVTTITTPTN